MSRTVFGLSLIYAVRMLGLFMVLPILSLALESYPNATATWIGVALGIYGATQCVFQLPLAAWSDRAGRKFVISVGLILFVLGSFLAAWADSIWLIIAGRALQGAGAVAATVMALMTDLVPEDRRGRAMASIGASIGLAFGVAMVIGPAIYSSFELEGVFVVGGLLGIVALILLWTMVPNPKADIFHNDVRAKGFREVFGEGELIRAAVGVFALHAALMAMFLSMPTLLDRLDVVSSDSLSWFYLAIIGSSFIFMVPLVILAEVKRHMRASLRIAVSLVCIACGVLFVTDSKYVLIAALWWFFVGFNLAEALLPSLVSKIAPVGRRGASMGIYSTAQFGGAFVGALLAGICMDLFGVKGPFAVAFVLSVVWLVAVVGMRPVSYLKNDSLSLEGFDRDAVAEQLKVVPGLTKVVFDEASNHVYMKVDADKYTRSAMLEAVDTARTSHLKN